MENLFYTVRLRGRSAGFWLFPTKGLVGLGILTAASSHPPGRTAKGHRLAGNPIQDEILLRELQGILRRQAPGVYLPQLDPEALRFR